MSIICATNFSPEAIAASTVAAELARKSNEELWLVFVMRNDTARTFGDQALATAEATLKGEAARLGKLGATVKHAMLVGKLHRELPRFVADQKGSLVIAGDTRKEPSPELRGEMEKLTDAIFSEIVDTISLSRGLSSDKVRQMIDDTMMSNFLSSRPGISSSHL